MDTYNVRRIQKKVVCSASMFLFYTKVLKKSHGEQLRASWKECQHERHKTLCFGFRTRFESKSE